MSRLTILKMLFGFYLLTIFAALIIIIAIGHVTKEGSYGLDLLIGGLLVLSGGFAHWAFGSNTETSGRIKDGTSE